ncbi:hypothetical protein KP509_03G063600 [Ceratopteris richardii]|uniref:Blue (type 1) copper domain-containing protein n=1 Tax=Ceratopteris richardii TaxID=49495 RepID=A0A8T2V3I3_CERRI|nr:hypothetical protein KP509_03G063600 [Ceratopteris richardii]
MASLAAPSASISSFCGLKAASSPEASSRSSCVVPIAARIHRPSLAVSASLAESVSRVSSAAIVAVTAAALVASAGPALAAKVEVGDEVGSFIFTPSTVTIAAGETIDFTLVGETGHNVVFDIPSGAPDSLVSELKSASMDENDLLSEDEPLFKAKLSTPGTYTYYCVPHKSANMVGTVIVK